MSLTVASTFSGVGGFDMAAELAGMAIGWQCEYDREASGVLEYRFPSVVNHGDIREVGTDARPVQRCDVLCGGFPCQDLSVAGARAGLAGERSGLFFQFMCLATVLTPRWILLENVPGLLSSNAGRDMGAVVGALGQLGYGWAYRVLDAQYFGVPQRRRRVFVVGCAGGDYRRAASVLFESASLPWNPPPGRETWEDPADDADEGSGSDCDVAVDGEGVEGVGSRVPAVAATLTSSGGGVSGKDAAEQRLVYDGMNVTSKANRSTPAGCLGTTKEQAVVGSFGVRRLLPVECERLQGMPDNWTQFGANGKPQSDTARYSQIGNAVAVPVVEWIFRRLVAAEARGSA